MRLSRNCWLISGVFHCCLRKYLLYFFSSRLLSRHTHTNMHTHTHTHWCSLVSCYRNPWLTSRLCLVWLRVISLLWNMLILSNKHMVWIGAWELHLYPSDRFSHILLWNERKSLVRSWKLIFSLFPCWLSLGTFYSMYLLFPRWLHSLLYGPAIQFHLTKWQNYCHGYCCKDAPLYWGLINLYGDATA